MEYASFGRRFIAIWLDFAILLPLTAVAYSLSGKSRMFYVYQFVPYVLVLLWFHSYLVARYGGTPGKLLLKIRIAMVDGSPVTANAALLRYSVEFGLLVILSLAIVMSSLGMSDGLYLSLGYVERNQKLKEMAPPWYGVVYVLMQVWVWSEFVTMLFSRKRRAVHDLMAGTVVIRSMTSA